jgi:hypothetical protein
VRSLRLAWAGEPPAPPFTVLPALADAFLADRQAAGLPRPDRQEVIDRLEFILGHLVPPGHGPAGAINGAELNQYVIVLDLGVPPWFGVTTATVDPAAGAGGENI